MRVLDRPLRGLPRGLRIAIDWSVTIVLAVVVVLAFEAEVAKPYRIPSASMEPTLHCSAPSDGCEAGSSDPRRGGAVPRNHLIGVVVATYWPPDRMTVR